MGTVLLKNWEDRVKKGAPGKRKREKTDEFLDEDVRKRPKAEEVNVSSTEANSGAILTGDGGNLERSPRDSLHSPNSPPTSLAGRQSTFTRASLPSPPIIHPDRQQSFTHPSFSNNGRVFPLSPLSRSPEHTSDGQVAEDVKLATKLQRSAAETVDESRTSAEGVSRPKPPRIDTARAMNNLDPRSPAYEQNTRDMASRVGKEERPRHRQGSRDQVRGTDRYQPSSNPPSRRQSETIPPPTSARPPRSERSTPSTSTPVIEKDSSLLPMGVSSTIARNKGSILKTSTPMDKKPSLPQNVTKQNHAPPVYNFSGFAQSIMSAASVNMRLENVEEEAAHVKRESLRQQKHGNTYDSLDDLINAKHAALEKSEDRLSKQLQGHNSSQGLIASRLDARVIQAPSSTGINPSISNSPDISEELAKLREEVDYLTRKCLRQSDLDRYSRKAVSRDDLSRFVEREDLVGGEKIVAEHTLDIRKLRDNVSDLSSVTGDRHHEAQEARAQNATRFEGVEANLDAAQQKIAVLETSLELRKETSTSLGVDLRELKDSLRNLNAFVRGDTDDDKSSLDRIVQKDSGKINQIADIVSQLKGRIEKVEEGAAKGSEPLHQPPPPTKIDSVQSGEIETLRQDMEILEKAKNDEYEFVVDQICKLEGSIAGLKADSHKQSQLLDSCPTPPVPPQASASANAENHQVKLEKLETDLKAFGTHFYVQQKKFDTLTTEGLAQSIIHQMKQLYPEHPGFVQDKLKAVEFQMGQIDLYLRNNLHPKLLGMDSAILARAGSDLFQQLCTRVQVLEAATQDAYVHTRSTREDLSKSIDVLKQDVANNIIEASACQNEMATKLGNIEGGLGVLSREKLYSGAAKNPNKRAKIALIEKTVEPDGTTEFNTPLASKSSSRQDSTASAPSGVLSSDEEESDAPISQRRERKRKLISSISDSEDDYGSTRRLQRSSKKK